MGDIIKLPGAMKYVEVNQIFEDDIFVIGIGINEDGKHILIIRCKPEGVVWHYNLNNDFDLALARFDE